MIQWNCWHILVFEFMLTWLLFWKPESQFFCLLLGVWRCLSLWTSWVWVWGERQWALDSCWSSQSCKCRCPAAGSKPCILCFDIHQAPCPSRQLLGPSLSPGARYQTSSQGKIVKARAHARILQSSSGATSSAGGVASEIASQVKASLQSLLMKSMNGAAIGGSEWHLGRETFTLTPVEYICGLWQAYGTDMWRSGEGLRLTPDSRSFYTGFTDISWPDFIFLPFSDSSQCIEIFNQIYV